MEAETQHVSVFSDDLQAKIRRQRASLVKSSSTAQADVSILDESSSKELDDTIDICNDSEDDGFLAMDDFDSQAHAKLVSEGNVTKHMEWLTESSPGNLPPWMDTSAEALEHNREAPFMVRLHNEIVDFYNYMQPTDEEHSRRKEVVETIRSIVTSIWPEAKVLMFGSMMTRTYLPFADIDLCIMRRGSEYEEDCMAARQRSFLCGKSIQVEECSYSKEIFSKLGEVLQRRGQVSNLEVLARARVPLLKFIDKATGIKIDITLNVDSGLDTGRFVEEKLREFPALRPLTFVLKYFLYCRGMSETYSGGVGSFLLQCLIISVLQKHPQQMREVPNSNKNEVSAHTNLGCLLYYFFVHYGMAFNYARVEVHVKNGGNVCKKNKKRGAASTNNRNIGPALSLINPCDTEHDVSANSWRFIVLKRAFKLAAGLIINIANKAACIPLFEQQEETILQTLLPVCPELMEVRPAQHYNSEERDEVLNKINESLQKSTQSRNNRKEAFTASIFHNTQSQDAISMMKSVMQSIDFAKSQANDDEKKKKRKAEKAEVKKRKIERLAVEQAQQLSNEARFKEYLEKENAAIEKRRSLGRNTDDGEDSDDQSSDDKKPSTSRTQAKAEARKAEKKRRKEERRKMKAEKQDQKDKNEPGLNNKSSAKEQPRLDVEMLQQGKNSVDSSSSHPPLDVEALMGQVTPMPTQSKGKRPAEASIEHILHTPTQSKKNHSVKEQMVTPTIQSYKRPASEQDVIVIDDSDDMEVTNVIVAAGSKNKHAKKNAQNFQNKKQKIIGKKH